MKTNKPLDYSYSYPVKNGKQTFTDTYEVNRQTKQPTLVERKVKENPPPKK